MQIKVKINVTVNFILNQSTHLNSNMVFYHRTSEPIRVAAAAAAVPRCYSHWMLSGKHLLLVAIRRVDEQLAPQTSTTNTQIYRPDSTENLLDAPSTGFIFQHKAVVIRTFSPLPVSLNWLRLVCKDRTMTSSVRVFACVMLLTAPLLRADQRLQVSRFTVMSRKMTSLWSRTIRYSGFDSRGCELNKLEVA